MAEATSAAATASAAASAQSIAAGRMALDSGQMVIDAGQIVLDHEKRLTSVERFRERAEPSLYDPERGLVIVVQDLLEWRHERDAQINLIRWTLGLVGVGILLSLADIVGQAFGILP
jgi:hypothetical protein